MSSNPAFLEAAATLGDRIASDAIWHDDRCNWMGAVAKPAVAARPEYRVLGPGLYGGTAGVGLFLAHLAVATGAASARRTAIGALRHALGRAAAQPSGTNFYGGGTGIAWAGATAAALLGEEELDVRGRETLDAAPRQPDDRLDLLTGIAGSIVGLLALDERRQAHVAGEALIARATVTRHGWSWPSPGARYPQHLCGISHGAAGIGWALLELFAATGDERFRTAAIGAFDYERSWLALGSGTWPDLRLAGGRRGEPPAVPSPAIGTWCHGEAGIAVTRLRAIEVLGPGAHCDDARTALATTRSHLASALRHDIADLSLCHGAAGAAEALVCATNVRGDACSAEADVATELGYTTLARYQPDARAWPCGVDGTTPSLFLGLSGIGWLFLRLYDPATPSPLAPQMRLTRMPEPA